MGHKSNIEWTEATWNPWHGCHKVSQGCKNCYMFRDKARYGQDPNVVVRSADKTFYAPLKWSEPRTIFTCSWSDFFIEEADAWRDEAFAIMALTPQHTYQVLTKRPERMLEYFREHLTNPKALNNRLIFAYQNALRRAYDWPNKPIPIAVVDRLPKSFPSWPFPNVWLGVSVEDQKTADERIPLLLQTPAAVRWLSIEPLLEPVDIDAWLPDSWSGGAREDAPYGDTPPIDWVVTGGESGPDARPMHPDWVRSIRDQCEESMVPFFFKQWGEWVALAGQEPGEDFALVHGNSKRKDFCFPIGSPDCEQAATMYRLGKKASGRILDGRTWDEMPK